MEKVIGIDLGTTFSAASYIDEVTGRAEIIYDPENQERITPSVVLFEDSENVIVGEIAKQNAAAEPDKVVEFVKRYMGRSKDDATEGWSFKFEGKNYSAQEISAYILQKIKQDAEKRLGCPVNKAVITVPAYFGEPQRAATAEAGRIAGFEVLSILDEPMAAAMAYGLDRLTEDQLVFTFDLGGGTFDVTIIEVKDQHIKELAVKGDPMLGGKDWDDALLKYVSAEFYNNYGQDPLDDMGTYQGLQLNAIRAKEELSRRKEAKIMVNHQGNSLPVEITRDKFEELTEELVERCRGLCELVMDEAGKTWDMIDTVLLVGGSTKMPMIYNMVKEISGKEPNMDLNPDECVAQGAAWHALMLHLRESPDDMVQWKKENPALVPKLQDVPVTFVTSHNLGVIALDHNENKRSYLMIPEMTEVPCEKSQDSFGTKEENQPRVLIQVTEGGLYMDKEDCDPEECRILGEVVIDQLPPLPKGSPIEVTLKFNENKILEVVGRDVTTGRIARAEINHPGGLSAEELAEAEKRLQRTKTSS